MVQNYTVTPEHYSDIEPFVITDEKQIVSLILEHDLCWLYDACSFRRHANLEPTVARHLLDYVHTHNGFIIITRGILMELASKSRRLHGDYVQYLRQINEAGIPLLLIYEEDLFSIMDACFSTNAVINDYLVRAVRLVNSPSSTIRATLEGNATLRDNVLAGKILNSRELYKNFFCAVREKKESDDNLGEELLSICLYLLSHLPGEEHGKYCIITDDKGAAAKVNTMFQRIPALHRGCEIGIFSTPKLVQVLHMEALIVEKAPMKKILEAGTDGNIKILGRRTYEIEYSEISLTSEELVELILAPNGISIAF